MPRKSIDERPMTDAERQARCRAARAAGTPAIRTRRPADHRSRAQRWCDAVAELTASQAHYAVWLEALPDSLQNSATAEALQAICDIDLSEPGQSFRRAASAETDPARTRRRLAPVGPQEPPARPLTSAS